MVCPFEPELTNFRTRCVGAALAASSDDSEDSEDSDDSEDDDELPSTVGSKRNAPQAKHSVKVRGVWDVFGWRQWPACRRLAPSGLTGVAVLHHRSPPSISTRRTAGDAVVALVGAEAVQGAHPGAEAAAAGAAAGVEIMRH